MHKNYSILVTTGSEKTVKDRDKYKAEIWIHNGVTKKNLTNLDVFVNESISQEESNKMHKEICENIIAGLEKSKTLQGDLGDIGNVIGIAVSKITLMNEKSLYSGFSRQDLERGVNHGYSLNDGTHD